MRPGRWLFIVFLALFAPRALGAVLSPQGEPARPRWFKGNTHVHTLESDGDSTPDEVTAWYKKHGYNFLVLTDHNVHARVDALSRKYDEDGRFLVMRGEEVTSGFEGQSVHVNGLDTKSEIGPQSGTSVLEILQKSVNAVRRQAGVPHINHPNFTWAITPEELQQVKDNKLFEISSGHPWTNDQGGGGRPGLEAAWDSILSNGVLLYGIAVDDAHHFRGGVSQDLALPGRGWVVVRSSRLDARSILDAMERGDFYASTGVHLMDYRVRSTGIGVAVRRGEGARFRIQFIGRHGRLLKEADGDIATYDFRGDEGYVRAKVIDSNGRIAWCQPVLVHPR
jgi:hypothetical protein